MSSFIAQDTGRRYDLPRWILVLNSDKGGGGLILLSIISGPFFPTFLAVVEFVGRSFMRELLTQTGGYLTVLPFKDFELSAV